MHRSLALTECNFWALFQLGVFILFSTAGIDSALGISQWEAELRWSCLNEALLLAVCSLKGWDFSSYIAMVSSCFPGGSLMALPGCRHKRIAHCSKLRVEEINRNRHQQFKQWQRHEQHFTVEINLTEHELREEERKTEMRLSSPFTTQMPFYGKAPKRKWPPNLLFFICTHWLV